VFQKKTKPFLYCDNLVRSDPILPILGRNIPGNLKQTHVVFTARCHAERGYATV